jgi:cytochrome c peroxidase
MELRKAFTPILSLLGTTLVAALAFGLWPAMPEPLPAQAATDRAVPYGEPILPIPSAAGLDAGKVALGKRLFHDSRLSKDDTVSCATCHNLQTAGVDGRSRSRGIHQREGKRNALTVFNACLNYRQFWDGHAASLEAQIDGPLQAEAEMGSNWQEVTAKLRKDANYRTAFGALYPDGIQPHTVKEAIVTFERSLVTPDAPFDRFLRGERDAISPQATTGYRHFKSYGCISCHQGVNVGGNLMQPLGVVMGTAAIRAQALNKDHRILRRTDMETDAQREQIYYRVPSLRNVARTGPYFHDGSTPQLADAVRTMGLTQLGRRLPDQDVADILAFLETLTGKYEGKTL